MIQFGNEIKTIKSELIDLASNQNYIFYFRIIKNSTKLKSKTSLKLENYLNQFQSFSPKSKLSKIILWPTPLNSPQQLHKKCIPIYSRNKNLISSNRVRKKNLKYNKLKLLVGSRVNNKSYVSTPQLKMIFGLA